MKEYQKPAMQLIRFSTEETIAAYPYVNEGTFEETISGQNMYVATYQIMSFKATS